MSGFENSYGGSSSKIADETRLECGVCWWVYDPGLGDDYWQIPPGTPFRALPEHWRCPNCDHPKSQFMVLEGASAERPERPDQSAGMVELGQRVEALANAYRAVDVRMRPLPVHNKQLTVEAIGFRRFDDAFVGVVVTPWCMNIVMMPLEEKSSGRPEGSKRDRVLPSGAYEMVAGYLEGVGPIEVCSLFSPMEDFDDPLVARLVAEHAAEGLFLADVPDAAPDAANDPGALGSTRDPARKTLIIGKAAAE